METKALDDNYFPMDLLNDNGCKMIAVVVHVKCCEEVPVPET